MDDGTLLERYREHDDRQALETLVERYRRPLFGYILNMTEGRGDAEDVFQEVWLRALKNLDRFTNRGLQSWLMRIARNLVIDRARKHKPELTLDKPVGDDEGSTKLDHVASDQRMPDEVLTGEDTQARVFEAVNRLPDDQKDVFLMRVKSELSFKEIAEIQDVSINTALARMQYALAKLRDMLAEEL